MKDDPDSPYAWQKDAECRDEDTELFFLPDFTRGPSKVNIETSAKSVCFECAVIQECLLWALNNNEEYGIWGGTTPEERAEMKANFKKKRIAR